VHARTNAHQVETETSLLWAQRHVNKRVEYQEYRATEASRHVNPIVQKDEVAVPRSALAEFCPFRTPNDVRRGRDILMLRRRKLRALSDQDDHVMGQHTQRTNPAST